MCRVIGAISTIRTAYQGRERHSGAQHARHYVLMHITILYLILIVDLGTDLAGYRDA
jgi:hypothetical protein